MHNECLVAALILGIMTFGFFRARRKNWGYAVLPIMVIPVAVGVVMYAVTMLGISYSYTFPMCLIVGSLAVSCIWIGAASVVLIKTKKLRVYYVGAAVLFSLTFAFLLLIQYQIRFGY